MKLVHLIQLTKGVYLDEEDTLKFGHLSAYVDDQSRIKIRTVDGKRMFLHSLLLNTDSPIDHINGNPADNRRCNIRISTLTQNQGNRKLNYNNKSGYKGIGFHKASGMWRARLGLATGEIYLGLFKTAEEAALAYNVAAKKYFEEFAKLNEVKNETN